MTTEINFNDQDNETLLILIEEAKGYHETFVSLNAPKETLDDITERIETMRQILKDRRKAVATEGQSEKKPIHSSSLKSQTPMKQTSGTQAQPQAKTEPILETTKTQRKRINPPFRGNDARRYRDLVISLQVQLRAWMLIKEENKQYKRVEHRKLVKEKLKLVVDHINSKCVTAEWKKLLLNDKTFSSGFNKKRFSFNVEKVLKDFDLN